MTAPAPDPTRIWMNPKSEVDVTNGVLQAISAMVFEHGVHTVTIDRESADNDYGGKEGE